MRGERTEDPMSALSSAPAALRPEMWRQQILNRIVLPPDDARDAAPPPHPHRRRALRFPRRDVRRPRSVPLPPRRAARSRRVLAPSRAEPRPLDPPRLRQLRLHRKDLRYLRRPLRPLVPGRLARAGGRLCVPARVPGPRLRVGGRERVRAVRVRCPARAGSDQPGGAGQCALAARGRTRGREGRAGAGDPRTFVAGISLAKTLTFLVVAPEEFG